MDDKKRRPKKLTFYYSDERDPGKMLAMGAVSSVPQIGATVELHDGKQAGTFRVLSVNHRIKVIFEMEIVRLSEKIEAGGDRPSLPCEESFDVFLSRVDQLFDQISD